MKLEQTILRNLIQNDDYMRKVLPFLKDEYFSDRTEKVIYDEILSFTNTYNSTPSIEAVTLAVKERRNLTNEEVEKCESYLQEIEQSSKTEQKTDNNWLIDKTEKFCQEKAVYNAIMDSIKIIDKKDKKRGTGSIPEILTEALSVSFDTNIGHDFIEDANSRYDYYHVREEKLQFDLEYFNKITKGGLSKKTLNIILASTGVGKTMFMTHCAAHHLTLGKNVLYLTMEMSEERIAERIDANLMDVTIDDLKELPKDAYEKKMVRIKGGTTGKLI